jgi:hypothetical protein
LNIPFDLEQFGDLFISDLDVDNIYIHIPLLKEIVKMLQDNLFIIIEKIPRMQICKEEEFIENELDDNMFWIARKK